MSIPGLPPLLRLLLCFTTLGVMGTTRAELVWSTTPTSTNANLWSLASNGSRLAAVGEDGVILLSSTSGIVWWQASSGTSAWLLGIAASPQRWVVVGDAGLVLTSTDDGETWQAVASPTTQRLNAVAYAAGRWIAVGEGGTVLTSLDGTLWTATSLPNVGFLRGLAWARGAFYVGGAAGTLYSTTDGVTFTRVSIATSADIEAIHGSAERVVVAGSGGLLAQLDASGSWAFATGTNANETYRGLVAFGQQSASVAGTKTAGVYRFDLRWWSRALQAPDTVTTAQVAAGSVLYSSGFGGRVSRAFLSDQIIIQVNGRRGRPGSVRGTYGAPLELEALVPDVYPNASGQWFFDDAAVPGATSRRLTLERLGPGHTGTWAYEMRSGSTSVRGSRVIEVMPDNRLDLGADDFLPGIPGELTTFAEQADGSVLVAGPYSFGRDEFTARGLARLRADGSLDETFQIGSGIDERGAVQSFLPLADGRILVVGTFQTIAGQPRPRGARLRANGTVDPTFTLDPRLQQPRSAFLGPRGIYVVNGREWSADDVYRILENGSIDPSFQPVPAYSIVGFDSQDRLVVHEVNPAGTGWISYTPTLLRRYHSDGSRDTSFQQTLEGERYLTIVGDRFYGTSSWRGRFGSSGHYIRTDEEGRLDAHYQPAAGWSYGTATMDSRFVYEPNGRLWAFSSTRTRAFDADGQPDSTVYAELPGAAALSPVKAGLGGTLWVQPSMNGLPQPADWQPLYRLRPRRGQPGRLINLSARSYVSDSADPLIMGFVTDGQGTAPVLARGAGPSLWRYGITDAVGDPEVRLVRDGTTVGANDDWDESLREVFASVGAAAFDAGSKDAALLATLGGGSHSVVVTPRQAGAGTVLAELYAVTGGLPSPRRFINLSARGPIGPDRPLIAGFVIGGDLPVTVLIRAAGPSLLPFGVTTAASDPRLTLYSGQRRLYENDDWKQLNPTQQDSIHGTGAFAFGGDSRDASLVATLPPGAYTAVVEGAPGVSGTALVEIYETQP